MTPEIHHQYFNQAAAETQLLGELLLAVLEQNDGLCLDNEIERASLASALTAALVAAAGDGTRAFPWTTSSARDRASEPPHT